MVPFVVIGLTLVVKQTAAEVCGLLYKLLVVTPSNAQYL